MANKLLIGGFSV